MLSDFQKKKIGTWFDLQDQNQDGLLKQEDFDNFAQIFNSGRGLSADSTEGQYIQGLFLGYWQMLRQMGSNDQVTREQFMVGHEAMLGNPSTYDATIDAMTDTIATVLDADHDGNCTVDEVASFYMPLGLPNTRENIANLDLNHDGLISRDEFRKFVREFYGDDPNAPGSRLLGELN